MSQVVEFIFGDDRSLSEGKFHIIFFINSWIKLLVFWQDEVQFFAKNNLVASIRYKPGLGLDETLKIYNPFADFNPADLWSCEKFQKNYIRTSEIWDFSENQFTTRHIKNKVIDFVSNNRAIMADKLPSTNLERFLRRIKYPLTRW